jgi:hypothetical protein
MRNWKRGMWPLAVVLAAAGLLSGASVASASQSSTGGDTAQTSKAGRHHRHHAKRGPRGPRGPRGVPGPAGPAGAAGPAGTGIPFSFALGTNAPTSIIFESNGLRIEAGCPGGALDLVARPEGGDHNIVEVTAFDNFPGEEGGMWGETIPDAVVNQRIPMLAGANPFHDFNGLLAVRTLAGQMTTVQWWAMGSLYSSQGDCVGGGTVSPH